MSQILCTYRVSVLTLAKAFFSLALLCSLFTFKDNDLLGLSFMKTLWSLKNRSKVSL